MTTAEEVSDAAEPRRGLTHATRALRHRSYRIAWAGALVSNVGTWMQNAVIPYVLYRLTRSGVWVGASVVALHAPSVVVAPWAGVIADRFDRRVALIWTQVLLALQAVGLWVAWVAGVRSPAVIVGFIVINGLLWGISAPVWQSLIVGLVPREDVHSAVTLNSAQFNSSRALGPALGGLALAIGPALAFFVNALSFVAVIVALLAVHAPRLPRAVRDQAMLGQFRQGLTYSRREPGIMPAIAVMAMLGFFGQPVTQLIAVFVKRVYDVGPGIYGLLVSFYGLGALAGSMLMAVRGLPRDRGRLVMVALSAMAASLLLLGLVPFWSMALLVMPMIGMTHISVTSTLQTTLQLRVDEEMRGRVIALWGLTFSVSYPVGALVQGWLADAVGVRATEVAVGGCLALIVLCLAIRPGFLDAVNENVDR